MDLIAIIGTALALSMDAFAISVASGAIIQEQKIRHAFRVALFFGGSQAIMPFLGWLLGRSLQGFIEGVDHWVAFGLLVFVGGKMIYEALMLEPHERKSASVTRIPTLLILSFATSLDAFAVGITISFLKVAILAPIILIGLITFLVSLAGVFIGDRFGHWFESKVELVGGLVLIAIGCKVLFDSFS